MDLAAYIAAALLVAWNTLALALVPFGLPGIWLLVLATAGLAWWQDGMFHLATVIALLGLAVLAEGIEFFSSVLGARKAGGTAKGAWGAFIGGLAGAIIGTPFIPVPVLGTVIAGCAGAFIGAALFERLGGEEVGRSLSSGGGAAAGRFVGTTVKLLAGGVMWTIAAVAAFWP